MSLEPEQSIGQTREDAASPTPARPAQTIIVPLDGSTHSLVALPVATTLAALEGATVHIAHVAERSLPPREMLQKLGLTPEALRGSVLDQATGPPAVGIVRLARACQS